MITQCSTDFKHASTDVHIRPCHQTNSPDPMITTLPRIMGPSMRSPNTATPKPMPNSSRVYLNGVKVAEAQGQQPPPIMAEEARQVDLKKIAAFYRALVKAGRQDSYEAAEARTAMELLAARHDRLQKPPPPPELGPIPPANREAVDALYFNTARWMAGGLVDRLAGRSVWQERVAPEILEIARNAGLLP